MFTTADYLLAVAVSVAFRSIHPDKATVLEVLEKLRENNIDDSKMVTLSTNHCQSAESSTGGGSST
jgi:hypothetical protein